MSIIIIIIIIKDIYIVQVAVQLGSGAGREFQDDGAVLLLARLPNDILLNGILLQWNG